MSASKSISKMLEPTIPILEVENLCTEFNTDQGVVSAVEKVSFSINKGEILGLVGESGSGKSVTGFSILGLIDPPGRVSGGRVRLRGQDILGLPEKQMQAIRGAKIATIFQDPMTSLHPLLRIGDQMIDAILAHRKVSRSNARVEARDALESVGISSPDERLNAFPHQLSGGMRQRVSIAIAMLNKPDLIIADEPTTALDVTIQAQILYETRKLCEKTGTAFLWITHDLAVVANLADKIAVMYAGSIVEQGPVDVVLNKPAHPYTAGLLSSVPRQGTLSSRLPQIPGSIASAVEATGCRFAPRCTYAAENCAVQPSLVDVAPTHQARCVNIQSVKIQECS